MNIQEGAGRMKRAGGVLWLAGWIVEGFAQKEES